MSTRQREVDARSAFVVIEGWGNRRVIHLEHGVEVFGINVPIATHPTPRTGKFGGFCFEPDLDLVNGVLIERHNLSFWLIHCLVFAEDKNCEDKASQIQAG
jgi:hypothetical protein